MNHREIFTFEGTVKAISYDNIYLYYDVSYEKEFKCRLSKQLKIKIGDLVRIEAYYYSDFPEIIKIRLLEYVSYEGIDCNVKLKGVVINSVLIENSTLFDVESNGEKIRCFISEKTDLMKNDIVIISGTIEELYGVYFLNISFINLNVNFNLELYLSGYFSEDFQEKLEKITNEIEDYALSFYGGVLNMFYHFNKELNYGDDRELILLSEKICVNERLLKSITSRIAREYVYRGFTFYEIKEELCDEIFKSRTVENAYTTLQKNPFYIIELEEKTAVRIEYRLKKQINEEQENISKVGRFIYKALTFKKWTSVPCSYLRKIFGEYYEKFYATMNNYLCVEYYDSIYYKRIKKMEDFVASKVAYLITSKETTVLESKNLEEFDASQEDKTIFYTTDEQFEAIKNCCNKNISIVTGGAGTGKTTILNRVNKILKEKNCLPLFVAYVGAAVQRIKEALKDPQALAFTIHLAIRLSEQLSGVTHVILDECSMIDLELLYLLFDKYFHCSNIKYIFIGDINQLEPISFGNVMANLLKCKVPITYLTVNFRSEEGILDITNEIINSQRQGAINWSNYETPDYNFYQGGESTIMDYILYLDGVIQRQNPKTKKEILKFLDKITVVTYFINTCSKVNSYIQETFLQGFRNISIDQKKFYEFDRVMNLKNNYGIDVMNGEIGRVIELNEHYIGVLFKENSIENAISTVYFSSNKARLYKLIVKTLDINYSKIMNQGIENENGNLLKTSEEKEFLIKSKIKEFRKKYENTGRDKLFTSQDVNEFFDIAEKYSRSIFTERGIFTPSLKLLDLAYCVTVRKAQGNQYDHCIVYHNGRSNIFLNKRVLYTEMSRAKKKLVVIATSQKELNNILLNPQLYTHENLSRNINDRLPQDLKTEEIIQITPDDVPFDDYDEDPYGDIDLSEIY